MMGISTPDSDERYGSEELALLAINQEGIITGFSFNEIGFDAEQHPLRSDGVIATIEGQHYYGYGLEAARQHFFQKFADREKRKLVHKINEQFRRRAQVWSHFYDADGVFGYGKKREKVYNPSESNDNPSSDVQGYRIIITKENNKSSWTVEEDNGVLDRCADLGLQDKDNLSNKLSELGKRAKIIPR